MQYEFFYTHTTQSEQLIRNCSYKLKLVWGSVVQNQFNCQIVVSSLEEFIRNTSKQIDTPTIGSLRSNYAINVMYKEVYMKFYLRQIEIVHYSRIVYYVDFDIVKEKKFHLQFNSTCTTSIYSQHIHVQLNPFIA